MLDYTDSNELFYEPRREVMGMIEFPEKEPEMSEFESAFLCGMIRKRKPKKIVEVGIAAGGTTAIIMDCLSQLGMNEATELHSIDCQELFYRGSGEKSGYLADEYKNVSHWHGKHKLFLGNYLPEVMEEIGDGIDFVILDTRHRLPGELLDFLAIFPYLKIGSLVVLHDISLNHIELPEQYATQLLLDVVVAEKHLMADSKREFGYPNIGAFEIIDDTSKYISDVFHALMITWNYLPDRSTIDLYLQSYEKNYSSDLVKLAGVVYELQCRTYRNKQQVKPESWKQSKSYKIGRMVTYLPRKIRGIFVKQK